MDIYCFCLFKKIFIGVQLIYNVVLVSRVQQSESVMHIHVSALFYILFPYRSLQSFVFLIFIYLALLGLSTQDLRCHMWDLLVVACRIFVAACEVQFPDQGQNTGPLHWEHGVLTTGPPGKSHYRVLSRVPCAIQQVLISYLFYIQQCVYVSPNICFLHL